jgi:hypothetical protein
MQKGAAAKPEGPAESAKQNKWYRVCPAFEASHNPTRTQSLPGRSLPFAGGRQQSKCSDPWKGHLLLGGLGYAEGAGLLRFDSCYEPWAYFAHTP